MRMTATRRTTATNQTAEMSSLASSFRRVARSEGTNSARSSSKQHLSLKLPMRILPRAPREDRRQAQEVQQRGQRRRRKQANHEEAKRLLRRNKNHQRQFQKWGAKKPINDNEYYVNK